MRRLVGTSVLFAALVLACASDYGSDDPKATDPDRDGGSSGTSGEGGANDTDGGGVDGNVVVPGKPITVTGKIVSYGVGMANVPVVVGGKPAVNTSTLGTFTVTDVQPPYDVAFALKTADAQPRVTVYQGLTRPDPTLVALGSNGELRPNPSTATLSGKVEGANGPAWTRTPIIGFAAPNRAAGFAAVDATTGNFTMQGTDIATWYGATSVTGSLHASLVLDNASPVTAFYGKLEGVAVTNGQTISGKNVTLASVPVATLTAKIAAPSGFNEPTKTVVNMGTRYQEAAGYFLKTTNPGAFPAEVKRSIPLVAGSSFQVNVGYSLGGDGMASFARATSDAGANVELGLLLAEPPAQTEPTDGAKDLPRSTPFTFVAFPNGIHRFTFVAANHPSVTIVTAATSVTLPDLTPFAIKLPENVEYSWRVAGFRPLVSVDADEIVPFLSIIDGSLPYVPQAEIAISPARKVTLAP